MSVIKSTLSLLCKELKIFCDVDIKAETIRRAKFNQASDENVEVFWLVLYRLCRKLMQKGFEEHTKESLESQVIFVKLCLADWGYKRIKFYYLPAIAESGGQELLIALAWLLANQNVFDKLIRYKILLFKQELKKFESNEPTKSYFREPSKSLKFEDELNLALMLCGKLKHNLNHIYRLRQQKANLLNKIKVQTQGLPGLEHLSLYEARMFFKASDGQLESVKELKNMISIYQKWEENSCLFWKWMDTVLAEARHNSCSFDYTRNQHSLRNFLQVLITKLDDKLNSLEEESELPNMNNVPSPIFSTESEEEKASQLKILEKLLLDQLSHSKSVSEEMNLDLQRQIKHIVHNTTNTDIFI